MKKTKFFLNILMLFLFSYFISGCVSTKKTSDNGKFYKGIIEYPATIDNTVGLIRVAVDSAVFTRIGVVYKYENLSFDTGKEVMFEVYETENILIAKGVMNYIDGANVSKYDKKTNSILNIHGNDHEAQQYHNAYHLKFGSWAETNVTGADGNLYNLGIFINDTNSNTEEITYAVDMSIGLSYFVDPNPMSPSPLLSTYLDLEGAVMINGTEYGIVEDANIDHSQLPHGNE